METTTVYRIENSAGYGPYSSDWPGQQDLHRAHEGCVSHPGPRAEGISMLGEAKYFGFTSLADLDTWFDGFTHRLLEAGYNIVSYVVESSGVFHGEHQVAFNRSQVVA